MGIGDCSLNIFFNIIIYRKGRIITTIEIEPPPLKILKISILKMVKIIPPPLSYQFLQGTYLGF